MARESIGRRIRQCRLKKHWNQEQLAEATELSVSYIGMLERGEKLPKLETFLSIANVLEVSADELLADELKVGYRINLSKYTDQVEKLSPEERRRVFRVLDALLEQN